MHSIARAVEKARGTIRPLPPPEIGWRAGGRPEQVIHGPESDVAPRNAALPQAAISLNEAILRRNMIASFDANATPSRYYDLLRDQIVNSHQSEDPLIVAVTGASTCSGTTVTAANLAFTFARNSAHRVALVATDDAFSGSLGKHLGLVEHAETVGALALRKDTQTVKAGNIPLCLTTLVARDREGILAGIKRAQGPQHDHATVTIIDLPTLPTSSVAMAYVAHATNVVVVMAADETTPADVQSCKSVLGSHHGVIYVLNKSGRHGL